MALVGVSVFQGDKQDILHCCSLMGLFTLILKIYDVTLTFTPLSLSLYLYYSLFFLLPTSLSLYLLYMYTVHTHTYVIVLSGSLGVERLHDVRLCNVPIEHTQRTRSPPSSPFVYLLFSQLYHLDVFFQKQITILG